MTREENYRRMQAAHERAIRRQGIGPIVARYEDMPSVGPRSFDIEAGNYPAGRSPIMAPPKMRDAPTVVDRVATRFAPDYSVHQYEDDVSPRGMALPDLGPTPGARAPSLALDLPGVAVSAVKAAPRFIAETAPAVGQALAEATGIPALARDAMGFEGSSNALVDEGDIAYMMGDTSGARDFYRQAEGQRLGTAGSLALTGIGAGSVVKGAQALRAGEGLLENAVAFNAASKAPGMALPTYAGIGAATAGPLIAAPAFADDQSREALAIEDRYVKEASGLVPKRPDAERARGAGFMQGLSLDHYDDSKRDPAKIAERDRLRAEWDASDKTNRDLAARLMNAEYEADPVGFEAVTSPEAFYGLRGRTGGEMATGAGTAVLSTVAGILSKKPIVINGIAGAAKGGVYGYGSGVGEVSEDDRKMNAMRDGVISTGVSAGLVPLGYASVKGLDNLPRTELRFSKFGPLPIPKLHFNDEKARLFAPKRLVLRDGVDGMDAVGIAQAADDVQQVTRPGSLWPPRLPQTESKGIFRPAPMLPRLEALVATSPEGRAAQTAAAAQRVSDRAAADFNNIRVRGPSTVTAQDVSQTILLPGQDGINAWRGLGDKQRKMAASELGKRLLNGEVSQEEYELLRTPEGVGRLIEVGLLPDDIRYANGMNLPSWPDLSQRPVNVGRQDRVPARINPDSAAQIGAALEKPYRINPETDPNSVRAPANATLNSLFDREKTPGPTPKDVKPTPIQKAGDVLTKATALAFAIPITGLVDKAAGDLVGYEKAEGKAPPMPLAADADLRRELAKSGLQTDVSQVSTELENAGQTFDEGRDADIASAQATLNDTLATIARLERTPEELPVRDQDGNVIGTRSNAAARRAALAKAKELRAQVKQMAGNVEALQTSREPDKTRQTSAIAGRLEGLRRDQQTLQAAPY